MSRILVAVDEEGLSSDTIAGLVGATFLVLAGKAVSFPARVSSRLIGYH